MGLDYLELQYDEIIFFLAILGAKSMNGLGKVVSVDLDEQEIKNLLQHGKQSLINRELLFIKQDEATLNDALVALVGSSVVPDATLTLIRIKPGETSTGYYFNATSEILVESLSRKPDIFSFAYLSDMNALKHRLEAILSSFRALSGYDVDELPNNLFLSEKILTRFWKDCQKNKQEAARRTLLQAGWRPDAAEHLVHDCSTYPSWMGLVVWNIRYGDTESLGPVMVIQGDDYAWLIENSQEDPEQFQIRPVPGIVCQDRLIALSEPLCRIYSPS